jgi:bifunctional N-acetylglucosamine-1-phosphate-uridyltransferase/glucosamine-1-phosphate-acetyltransferase GlmU-like protein
VRSLLVIPAAGRGSRLGSDTPKPLVRVAGRTMLDRIADLYTPFVGAIAVIAHPSFAGEIRAWGRRRGNVSVEEQAEPTGMLDAIQLAAPIVRRLRPDTVWITWADQITVLPETLRRLEGVMSATPAPPLALPTVTTDNPYTHFERDSTGRIVRFLESREGARMPARGESDMGLFAMTRDTYETELAAYAAETDVGKATGERNFAPFVPWLARRAAVVTFPSTHPMEAVGVNTPEDLARVEAWLRARDERS